MNNNNLDQVRMQSSKRRPVKFNFKHTNDTSCSIGEIQCMLFQEVQPGSNSICKGSSTIRLDPMVVPTAGELKLHHNFAFVGIDDLFPKFAALLAEQPVQFGLESITPTELPYINLQVLTALCMIGGKFSIYLRDSTTSAANADADVLLYDYSYSGTDHSDGRPGTSKSAAATTFLNRIQGGNDKRLFKTAPPTVGNVNFGTLYKGYNGPVINIARLLKWSDEDFWIPTRNWSTDSLLGFVDDASHPIADSAVFKSGMFDIETIGLGFDANNDLTFDTDVEDADGNTVEISVAVKFSTFGQRFFKLLLSMGYGFSLTSGRVKSLAPLLGVYKCWFDSFAPTIYQGWETTNCAKILSLFDSENFVNWGSLFGYLTSGLSTDEATRFRVFMHFIYDLCTMWYTEEQDAVSMYIRSNAVSTQTGVVSHMAASGVLNINDRINIAENPDSSTEPSAVGVADGAHAYINNLLHSELDSELLKRLYKVVNRNTIAGRRIKQLLEAQGLGDYVKNCRSNFIGHSAIDIDIFDVTATADTLNKVNGDGMYTGEYVGKGVGEDKIKTWKFKVNAFGYIYDLAAIVPESGWTNCVNAATENIKKLDFYNAEYDGLGYEAARKSVVTSVEYGSKIGTLSGLDDTFGYAPKDSRHKVRSNIFNGYFGLHSRQKAYLPYSFNKFVEVGSKKATLVDDSNGGKRYVVYDLLTADKLPIASPMYRFIGRYAWMGRFRRIFAALGVENFANLPQFFDDFNEESGESVKWLYNALDLDNFVVHNVFLFDYWAPMLAIEDSFETKEEGNNGYSDLAQGKA